MDDFNNDGWKDLFVAQGHVMDNIETVDPSLHYRERPMLALNHNGRFERQILEQTLLSPAVALPLAI